MDAEAQAKTGDRAGAKQSIRAAKKAALDILAPHEQIPALRTLAQSQAETGDIPGARQTALGVACSYNLIHLYADAEENFRQALGVAPETWPAAAVA